MGVQSLVVIINQECCTSAFSLLLLQQPLLHPAVLSTVKPQLQPLLPHGKSPSKSQEAISVEDPSSPPDSSCLLATANKEYPAGTIAQITGWGKTHGNINQTPTQLQVATTPLMSQDDCKAIWGNLRITDRMQCVGGTGENSGCQGDSGGPLAYQDPADGVWYLIGNTSWGSSSCQTSMPAIWSKNVIVYDWIQSFL